MRRRSSWSVAEARELVPGAAVVAVSAKTGEGLDELRAALASAADGLEHAALLGATRLYVDRAFTLHGIGTVVTGTLWSGSIGEGDELRAEPAGIDVRVRSVQVHDEPVERAEAGQRVALALPGVERSALHRGDALVEPGAYPVSYRLDVELDELEPIADRARVHVHHGTAETAAGVVRVGERFAQLRLAQPVVAARGDRVVLRDATTLGGGRVLDPAPPRAPDPARLELLSTDDPESIVKALVHEPVRADELAARALLSRAQLEQGLAGVERADEWYFSAEWLEHARREARTRLTLRAEAAPLDAGLAAGELLPRSAVGGRRSCPCSSSSGGTARSTSPEPAQVSASAPRRPRRSKPSSQRRASPRSPSRILSWRASSKARADSSESATGSRSAAMHTSRRNAFCSTSAADGVDHARPVPRPPRRLPQPGPAPARALRRRRPHAPDRRRPCTEAGSYDRRLGSGMGPVAQLVFKTGAVV